jgi:guanine nucleotide-binding protein subunit beta-2-like 1 protein
MVSKAEGSKTEFVFQGVLRGHDGWITSIAPGIPAKEGESSDVLVTGSRDRSVMIWKLEGAESDEVDVAPDTQYGYPLKKLTGHNHFVTDIALSNENHFALSSSWDKTLRLWDLRAGKSSRLFVGHTKEVLSCCFSYDNRQIISTGADKTIKLWNTVAECKFTFEENNHTDWVSSIRYSPIQKTPFFATAGWDGRLKIWNSNFLIKYSFKAHETNINSLSIAPMGAYIATGGKENCVKIWDLADLSQEARKLQTSSTVNQVAFNPKMQWIAAATETGVKIFDLAGDSEQSMFDIVAEKPKKEGKPRKGGDRHAATCLAWSADGKKLYAGFTDNLIRVYHVSSDK